MWEVVIPIGLLAIVIGFVTVLIRGIRQMWDGDRETGGFGSGVVDAISEVDRIVRPSIEEVIKAKSSVEKYEDNVGGA